MSPKTFLALALLLVSTACGPDNDVYATMEHPGLVSSPTVVVSVTDMEEIERFVLNADCVNEADRATIIQIIENARGNSPGKGHGHGHQKE